MRGTGLGWQTSSSGSSSSFWEEVLSGSQQLPGLAFFVFSSCHPCLPWDDQPGERGTNHIPFSDTRILFLFVPPTFITAASL